MALKSEISVGQTVWLKTTGNLARRGSSILERKVTKVGNKYFEIEGCGQFHVDSLVEKTEYSPNYKAYLNKQELENEHEYGELSSFIRDYMRLNTLTLQQARDIKKILTTND